jgi:hypothetical protein
MLGATEMLTIGRQGITDTTTKISVENDEVGDKRSRASGVRLLSRPEV